MPDQPPKRSLSDLPTPEGAFPLETCLVQLGCIYMQRLAGMRQYMTAHATAPDIDARLGVLEGVSTQLQEIVAELRGLWGVSESEVTAALGEALLKEEGADYFQTILDRYADGLVEQLQCVVAPGQAVGVEDLYRHRAAEARQAKRLYAHAEIPPPKDEDVVIDVVVAVPREINTFDIRFSLQSAKQAAEMARAAADQRWAAYMDSPDETIADAVFKGLAHPSPKGYNRLYALINAEVHARRAQASHEAIQRAKFEADEVEDQEGTEVAVIAIPGGHEGVTPEDLARTFQLVKPLYESLRDLLNSDDPEDHRLANLAVWRATYILILARLSYLDIRLPETTEDVQAFLEMLRVPMETFFHTVEEGARKIAGEDV